MPENHTDDPVAALWGEYKQHHTPDVRERLILHYAPLRARLDEPEEDRVR